MSGTSTSMAAWILELFWSGAFSAVLLAILAFIAKNWIFERLKGSIKFDYDQALERYKADLKREGDKELESLKAALKAQSDSQLELLKGLLKSQSDSALEILKAELKAKSDAEIEGIKANLKARGDAEIEAIRALNQRWIHIDKSQFDLEFKSFAAIWAQVSGVVDTTTELASLYQLTEGDENKGKRRSHATDSEKILREAFKEIKDTRPFIPEDVHHRCLEIAERCNAELGAFCSAVRAEEEGSDKYNEEAAVKLAGKTAKKILKDLDNLADAIRTRLSLLSQMQSGPTRELLDAAPVAGPAS